MAALRKSPYPLFRILLVLIVVLSVYHVSQHPASDSLGAGVQAVFFGVIAIVAYIFLLPFIYFRWVDRNRMEALRFAGSILLFFLFAYLVSSHGCN